MASEREWVPVPAGSFAYPEKGDQSIHLVREGDAGADTGCREYIAGKPGEVVLADGRRYGYHWYLGASATAASQRLERWVGGIGWGGQRLYVFPALDLVVAQHCGNYNKSGTEQRRINDAIITEIVLPGLV